MDPCDHTGNYRTALVFAKNSQKSLGNKKHQYKGVDTGQVAYSSYTGLSRDHDLEGRLAGLSLHKLLATTETLTDWFEVLARETQLKRVILFNGRNNQYRPILRLARQLGIEAEVIECFGQVAENVFTFRNNLAQDFDLLQEYTEESWRTFQGDKGRWRRKRAFRPPRSISGGHRPEPKADCCRMGPRGQRAGGPARSLPRWGRPRR